MRGKVQIIQRGNVGFGITPAYAGKSFPQNRINVFVKDHPRLCGEKPNVEAITLVFRGSPPPMRGKACLPLDRVSYRGITPAYAGKRKQLSVQKVYV